MNLHLNNVIIKCMNFKKAYKKQRQNLKKNVDMKFIIRCCSNELPRQKGIYQVFNWNAIKLTYEEQINYAII